jgi:hypothetical protein
MHSARASLKVSAVSPASRPSQQPVFIVGCGRSGTTLMRLMLSAAGDLMIPPECDFLWRAVRRFGADASLTATQVAEFVSVLEHISSFPGLELTAGDLLEGLQASGASRLADCVSHVYATYAARQGRSRWGDKNPFYVLYLNEIRELYPQVRVIHMVRDGRDVAVSYRSTKMRPYNTFVTAHRWVRCVQTGQAWGARHPDQYLEIRYESLIEDPEGQLRRVAPFVGEPYSDAMLSYYLDNQDLRRIPVHDRAHHGNLAKPIMTKNREKWRTQMSDADRHIFEWVAEDTLEAFGYIEQARPTPPALLPYLWSSELRWRFGATRTVRAIVDCSPWRVRTGLKKAFLIDNEHYR